MNSHQRRKQRRKRKVWSFVDIKGLIRPLKYSDLNFNPIVEFGAVATNARPDSSNWANKSAADVMNDINDILYGARGGGKTELLKQKLKNYNYNHNQIFGSMYEMKILPPEKPYRLADHINVDVTLEKPIIQGEILPPEETTLIPPPPPGYHHFQVPIDYGNWLVRLGLAFLPGTEPLIIEAQKPRLTEGE